MEDARAHGDALEEKGLEQKPKERNKK